MIGLLTTAVRGAATLLVLGVPALADEPLALPVPRLVIYPGEVITEDMLDNGLFAPETAERDPVARSPDDVVGRAAKRMLLPNRPIPMRSTAAATVIARGATVTVVLVEGGLQISTPAQSLESGAAGDLIRVRNLDSGVVVSGTVGEDGVVRIGVH